MRILAVVVLLFPLTVAASGCGGEPKGGLSSVTNVDSFSGQIVQDGKPLQLPEDGLVTLQMLNNADPAHSFNVGLKTDGSFSVTKVPAGLYKACLQSPPPSAKNKGQGAGSGKYFIPGEVMIESGKSDYKIEAGKDWKPPHS